jgi:hypothetical protein
MSWVSEKKCNGSEILGVRSDYFEINVQASSQMSIRKTISTMVDE